MGTRNTKGHTMTLAPVTITRRSTNLRTGRKEIWEAVTKDGAYTIERIEDIGTPWAILRNADKVWVGSYYGSLRKARLAIALGQVAS